MYNTTVVDKRDSLGKGWWCEVSSEWPMLPVFNLRPFCYFHLFPGRYCWDVGLLFFVGFWDERCVFCRLLTVLENLGLESPNFPGPYNNSETCVALMPAFSAVTVTAFSTEQYFDLLIINQQSYSGTSRDIENKTFVIRPNSTNISWFPDGSGSLSGWQLCLDTPPACSDGFPVPVTGEDCPSSIENLSSCETAALDTLCIGDGRCHTRMDIDNCGQADIYRKMRSESNGTTFPYDPIPVLVGSAPRPSPAESRRRRSRRRRSRPPPLPCYHRRRGKTSHRRRFASDDTEESLLWKQGCCFHFLCTVVYV